jgi:cellobiose transport system permease protein
VKLTRITLVVACVMSVFPIYWMFVIATRSNDVVNDVPPPLLPGGELTDNVRRVFANDHAAFAYGLINSVFVSAVVTVAVVIFATMAGFAFAKLRFRGRNALLLTVIATMMVPVQLGLIPLYMLMVKIGWNGDLKAVIGPSLVCGFGVFMIRQYAVQAVTDELVEAARVDGCSTFRIYLSVVLPVLRPAAAVLALLTFMQTWNDFLWPYAVLDADTPTVQLSLSLLATAYYTDYAQVFAATAISTVPLLVVFAVFGRQIIWGIMEGAVKQ